MVIVMLTVMLLMRNLLTLPIFSALQLRALLPGHHAISFGAILPGLQTPLPALKASGFLRRQRAGLHPLLNTLFLIGLALIKHRR